MKQEDTLVRSLKLPQATVLNMIEMVGIGPFITIPIVMVAFPGKFSLLPWLVGAVIALFDGFIWGELGSAWPQAGGSYVFLRKLFKGRLGHVLSFLYVFQTSLHLPLVMTSAAIGIVNYAGFLIHFTFWQEKLVMVGVVLLVVILLYRQVGHVGKIGMVFSVIVVGLLLWTIVTGFIGFDPGIFDQNLHQSQALKDVQGMAFWFVIGHYTTNTIYAFLGYYNVCNIGSEIKNPKKNIPRSIIISIVGIAILYLLMQGAIAGAVLPTQVGDENVPVVSILFEQVYGKGIAEVATIILLVVACSSLFSLMLGYTRVIYAAAKDGMHFKWFAHLHPRRNFPDYALLVFGALSIVFCILFRKPSIVFGFIVIMRIFIQFIPQALGVIHLRMKKRTNELHFKMPLYPFVPILSIIIWVLMFIAADWEHYIAGVGVVLVGLIVYYLFFRKKYIDES